MAGGSGGRRRRRSRRTRCRITGAHADETAQQRPRRRDGPATLSASGARPQRRCPSEQHYRDARHRLGGCMTALARYRVLDLTTERGWLCGKLLADLGADVVKVEPPGGDPGRRRGLFADPAAPAPDPEANLVWWHQNRGKRSIVVDLDTTDGHERLLELVEGADVLVESSDPGWLEDHGLGPDDLLARNPQLVVTSISPYGRTGPHGGWAATDLTVAAGAGTMWLTGDPDRAPVRISSPQLWLHAAAEAAVDTLIALVHAQRSGTGQHVDVSAQLAGIRTLMNAQAFHLLEGRELMRMGGQSSYSHARFRMVTPCADGFVTILPIGGAIGGPMMRHLFDWAEREGVADPDLVGLDFSQVDFAEVSARPPEEASRFFDGVSGTIERLFATKTKAELYDAALEHRLLLAPVTTVADLRADEQLAARSYWDPVDQGGPDGAPGPVVHHPGPWARLSATPLRRTARAPHRGEHTAEVLAEAPRRPTPAEAAAGSAARTAAPFEGLKVFDMSWVGVGPMTAGYLASYGASVVKLESSERPDVLRLTPPFRDGKPGLDNSHFFGDFNAGKLGLGVDVGHPKGREVVWRLLEWADVVLESFTPKTMRGWGMAYDDLAARNPGLVMLSTCMQGQTGPRANYRGFGNLMASLAGFYELTGWPDRPPAMVYGAYTDFVSQRFTTMALVAAVDHRRRTGEGQHIDVAQLEAALQFLGPELLAYDTSGHVATRDGNRDPDRCPHGVHRCRPEPGRPEGWVAIACDDDEQWAALVEALGSPDWASGPALRTLAGRRRSEARIEAGLGAWASARTPAEVVAQLQPRVPAAVVQGVPELHEDPQVRHRGYWVPLDHPVYGLAPYSGLQATLSVTPGALRSPAPCLGQHSWEVLTTIAGYDEDEVAMLLAEDVVEMTG
ncbi:MAG: hypothetical protein GEV08_03960 [Acidimicrobiia bacterium]|nr:hypothetical protein [Acidimicrobiia bacterium]